MADDGASGNNPCTRNEGKKKIYGKTSWSEDCRQKCCYLGEGSFGKVYRGLYGDDEKKIQVAVKRTEIKLEAKIYEILEEEKPQHENIVKYLNSYPEKESVKYVATLICNEHIFSYNYKYLRFKEMYIVI